MLIDPSTTFDVTNYPPTGCYYYDRFCDQRFVTLDDYTDHLQGQNHPATIEIIRDDDGGDLLHKLEFADGVWRVQN